MCVGMGVEKKGSLGNGVAYPGYLAVERDTKKVTEKAIGSEEARDGGGINTIHGTQETVSK